MLRQDQSITIVFDSLGVYEYQCTIHPNMQATLKVSNHLAFAFGDLTPDLAELCERLGIGYRIVDAEGIRQQRPA